MSYKNAGITSIQEAEKRLKEGEVFRYDGREISYDAEYIRRGQTPYRYGSEPLKNYWDRFKDWRIKTEWFNNIPEHGVLCWVGDSQRTVEEALNLQLVISYPFGATGDYPYETKASCYSHAVPATIAQTEKLHAV